MQLNKTSSNIETGKTALTSAKNAPQAKAVSKAQTNVQVKTIDTQSARSITSLIKASGLPQDKLSANVLSFARFFSLALKPDSLAAIRRLALAQQAQNASQNAQFAARLTADETAAAKLSKGSNMEKVRAVFSLAAAAAESKGVELQPKGMELYADAIDPDADNRRDGDGQNKEKRNKNKKEKEEKDAINADSIKKLALESAENYPVLQIMNKLPGKNGQKWIVLPFEFSQDGNDYKVSMRVLMERETVVFMTLDIAVSSEKRESFAIEFINSKVSKIIYYSDNRINKQDVLKKELACLFELSSEKVFVKSGARSSNLSEADYGEELLRFIDEAC